MSGRSIRQPDVVVRQTQQTVSPVTQTPELLACEVAPLYDIVEGVSAGVANASALLEVPAYILGTVVGTTVVPVEDTSDALVIQTAAGVQTIDLSVSGDPDQASYSLALIASQIEEANVGLQAEVLTGGTQLLIWTTLEGDGAFMKVLDDPTGVAGSVQTLLGLTEFTDVTRRGASSYKNQQLWGRFSSLPALHGTAAERTVDPDTIRLFLSKAGVPIEVFRDRATLRSPYENSFSTVQNPFENSVRDLEEHPNSRFAHRLRVKDDNDGDGTTPKVYAPGTNSVFTIFDAADTSNALILEAWGDQDMTDIGPYHGVLGDSLSLIYAPGENTLAATLVSIAGTDITITPTVRLLVSSTIAHNAAELAALIAGPAALTSAGNWTAKVKTIVASGANFLVDIYDIAGITGNEPDYKDIVAAQTITNDVDLATWTIQASGISIVSTLAEIKAALTSVASSLCTVTSYGTLTGVPDVEDDVWELALTTPADNPEALKKGDVIILSAGSWEGLVVDVDSTGPTIKLDSASTALPAAAQTFYKKGGDSTLVYTILAGTGAAYAMAAAHNFFGGRNPIGFADTPGTATCKGMFPAGVSVGANHVAAYLKVTAASTLPKTGYVIGATSGFYGKVIDSGGDYLIIGMNPNGEQAWPQDAETVTIVPDSGTAVTAVVAEFHTVLTTPSLGTTDISIGDTLYMNDAATEVARCYRLASVLDPVADVGTTVNDVGTTWTGTLVDAFQSAYLVREAALGLDPTPLSVAGSAVQNAAGTWTGTVRTGSVLLAGPWTVVIELDDTSTTVPTNAETWGVIGGPYTQTIDNAPAAPGGAVLQADLNYGYVRILTGVAPSPADVYATATCTVTAVVAPVYNEWAATVVSSTRIDDPVAASAREYRLVLKNMSRTTVNATSVATRGRGLPGGQTDPAAGVYGLSLAPIGTATWGATLQATVTDDGILTHYMKTIPTAGCDFQVSVNGSAWADVSLSGTESVSGGLASNSIIQKIKTAVSDEQAAGFASVDSDYLYLDVGALPITNPYAWREHDGGQESTIRLKGDGVKYVFGNGLAVHPLYEDYRVLHRAFDINHDYTSMPFFGQAFVPAVGDEFYNGSTLLGTVETVESLVLGGQTFLNCQIKLDREVSSSTADIESWSVLAKNLTEDTLPAAYTAAAADSVRPYPQLAVFEDTEEFLIIHDLMRTDAGAAPPNYIATAYATHWSLRLDVTASADDAALQLVTDSETLVSNYGPVRPDNPLAWALYTAMSEGPNRTISALGLDAISATELDGTLLAHARARDFLETAVDVYSIHLHTYNKTKHDLWATAVESSSTPPALDDDTSDTTNLRERVVVCPIDTVTEELPTTVVTGSSAAGATNEVLFPGTVDVRGALQDAGGDPDASASELRTAGVYVQIASSTDRWLVRNITGNLVQITRTHPPGGNDDSFYSTAAFAVAVGDEVCTLYIRGDDIQTAAEKSEALATLAETYENYERIVLTYPSSALMTYNGADYVVEGHYLTSVLAGWMSYYRAAQPMTNMRSRSMRVVYGTDDTHTPSQLNRMAGGGMMLFFRPNQQSERVLCRHALTNDTTDEIRKQLNILRQRDVGAWTMRRNLRELVGKHNITDNYVAFLTTIVQSAISTLVSNGDWQPGSKLLKIYQDTTKTSRIRIHARMVYAEPNDYIDFEIVY
jgi:hypothetical protein